MSSIWRWWCSSKAAISGPCSVAHMKNSFGSCVLRGIVTGSTGRPEGTGGLFIRIAALVLSPAVRGNNRTACTAGAEANTPTKIHSRCRERRKSTPSNPRQKSKEREREHGWEWMTNLGAKSKEELEKKWKWAFSRVSHRFIKILLMCLVASGLRLHQGGLAKHWPAWEVQAGGP